MSKETGLICPICGKDNGITRYFGEICKNCGYKLVKESNYTNDVTEAMDIQKSGCKVCGRGHRTQDHEYFEGLKQKGAEE